MERSMIHALAISDVASHVCCGWTPLDAVVTFQSELLLRAQWSISGCVESAATSRLWFQLLNQLETSLHAPSDWLNAEVWWWRRKEEWVSEGRRPEFTVTVFVDNLQSADTVKFSLVDVWVCLWVYLLMLHAQPCSTCEVFPALLHNWCFILYCVMQRPRPPQDPDVCSVITCSTLVDHMFIHFSLAFYSISCILFNTHTCSMNTRSRSLFFLWQWGETKTLQCSQSPTSFHSLRVLSSRHPSHSLFC